MKRYYFRLIFVCKSEKIRTVGKKEGPEGTQYNIMSVSSHDIF
jgi:hypothetical protein